MQSHSCLLYSPKVSVHSKESIMCALEIVPISSQKDCNSARLANFLGWQPSLRCLKN